MKIESKLIKTSFFIGAIIISSCVYLNSYWGSFSINIFPFLDLNNVFLSALAPLISNSIPYIITALVSVIILGNLFPYGGYKTLKERGELTKNDIVLKNLIILILFIIMPILTIISSFINKEVFYNILPGVVTIFSIFLVNFSVKHKIIFANHLDSTLVAIIVFVLLSSYTTGKSNANKILLNKEFKYMCIDSDYYKFLGKAGSSFFYISLCNSEEIILNSNNNKSMTFHNYNSKLLSQSDSIIFDIITEHNKNAR